jgi:hypothetical protein
VTFDKESVSLGPGSVRAELVSPGHPLLAAIIATTLERHGGALAAGTTLVDPIDYSDEVRILVSLEHTVTDGRPAPGGGHQVVSRRVQFVEIAQNGTVKDPGAEPYLNYEPLSDEERASLSGMDLGWVDGAVEHASRNWAIANLASPHFSELSEVTKARVERTRVAVEDRLNSEIRFWDARAAELKEKELHGKAGRLNSGRARQRADDLEARKQRRLRELDLEADLVNHPPTVLAAALVIPRGLLDRRRGDRVAVPDQSRIEDTDRRAIQAVLEAERTIGRDPEEQHHNNPGFDILSTDPRTGLVFQIEVKGHRVGTTEIEVRARQVRQAKQNPDRFRLAVVTVPEDELEKPVVRYFIRPFDGFELHFAQTHLPLNVAELARLAVVPQ